MPRAVCLLQFLTGGLSCIDSWNDPSLKCEVAHDTARQCYGNGDGVGRYGKTLRGGNKNELWLAAKALTDLHAPLKSRFLSAAPFDLFDVIQHQESTRSFEWGLKPGPPDLQANALPTELSERSVASLNLHCLYKVMLYWFQKWTKSNMWSGAWNKQSSLQKSPAQQIPA